MKNTLFKNIGFLGFSQAANYILPLVTIPYITRIVGPENYGLIEFATVAMLYFSALVIYGFNTTATRKIAETPHNIKKVSFVFSAALTSRLLLFIISAVLFLVSLLVIPKFQGQHIMMIYAFPIVLGWAVYPDFLFQGLQKLKVVALANFAVKTLAAILVFVLLKSAEDFYYVLGINAAAQVIVGLATLVYAFKSIDGLRFQWATAKAIKTSIAGGTYVFLSHFFTRISTFGTIVFIGFMLQKEEVGLFAAGWKLIMVAQSFLFLPLFGALFPYLANLYRSNRDQYFAQFKRALLAMLVITLISSAILFLAPAFFVKIVFGESYLSIVPYLKIMAPILIFTTLSHFGLHQGLIILKRDKRYLQVIVGVGLLSLLMNYIFIEYAGLAGAVWVKLVLEITLAALSWWFYRRELHKTESISP